MVSDVADDQPFEWQTTMSDDIYIACANRLPNVPESGPDTSIKTVIIERVMFDDGDDDGDDDDDDGDDD
jgi:hypothetical protein